MNSQGELMHLLLGDRGDLCCMGVLARMEARGLAAQFLAAPLAPPALLTWRLDEGGLSSRYACPALPDGAEIDSVLVRGTGWLDSAGWDPNDREYMQAELQATLLAWLASLPCPVINREKPEGKELKLEKLENDGVFDPGTAPIPDPRIEQVIRAVSGLSARVSELTDQIEELKKRGKK